tara:strand:+ start:1074 stop:1892 length:819 start_codon:yes stop_codon:yes gene_type:complete
MSLVSTDWLFNNLNNVKIIDSSWHLPNQNRNPFKEYSNEHILNSIFFDIDKYSDQKTDLPHMLPKIEEWEKIVSNLGISNRDKIIVYDNSDLISSCRCWYTFLYFGHDSSLISVLNGGLKKWKQEGKPVVNTVTEISRTHYFAKENKEMVKSKIEIDENISLKKFKVIDARSKERFEGKIPEPRSNVKSGSIKNSSCLPFGKLINKNDNTFNTKNQLTLSFKEIINIKDNNVVFSCGSGVTASVLALAYSLINNKYMPTIYDGSWAEYGLIK